MITAPQGSNLAMCRKSLKHLSLLKFIYIYINLYIYKTQFFPPQYTVSFLFLFKHTVVEKLNTYNLVSSVTLIHLATLYDLVTNPRHHIAF